MAASARRSGYLCSSLRFGSPRAAQAANTINQQPLEWPGGESNNFGADEAAAFLFNCSLRSKLCYRLGCSARNATALTDPPGPNPSSIHPNMHLLPCRRPIRPPSPAHAWCLATRSPCTPLRTPQARFYAPASKQAVVSRLSQSNPVIDVPGGDDQ